MTADRWQEIERLYNLVLDQEPSQRIKALTEACQDNLSLRLEIEALLQANELAEGFLTPGDMKQHLRGIAAEEAPSRLGSAVGHYQILSVLGTGGMGEVYLADDQVLGRQVALKILPERFMENEQHMNRFVREAKAASALNHPNILTIYEVGRLEKTHFIVTEFVNGETLRQKIARGPIPIPHAIEIAIQCCTALEAAHGAGIVHRDIKPENIMVRPDGLVKILDFGLARTRDKQPELPGGVPADCVDINLSTSATATGVIVGTPSYMSPEQASGQAVDERSDLFSLGAVIYELVTSRPAFPGASAPQVIESLLTSEPDQATIPAELNAIVRKMLAKDRAERFQSAAEIARGLRRLSVSAPRSAARTYLTWAAALAALAALVAVPLYTNMSPRHAALALTVPLTSFNGVKNHVSFSPDGKRFAFEWDDGKPHQMHIYIKTIGDTEPVQLTVGPGEDFLPAWSPDDRWIAFQRGAIQSREIYVVPTSGNAPRKLTEGGVGVSWSPDAKYLVFPDVSPPAGSGGIVLFEIATGRRRPLTTPQPFSDGLPVFSPNGKYVAFDRSFSSSARELMVVPVDGGSVRQLTSDRQPVNGQAWTADSRELVFESNRYGGNALWRVAATGSQPRRVEAIGQSPTFPAISRRGDRLAYTETFIDSNVWRYPATGLENQEAPSTFATPSCLLCSSREDESARISPDGRRIVFVSKRTGADEIWVANSDDNRANRLTFIGGSPAGSPRWSSDSQWIAFDSRAAGQPDIYVVNADGGKPRRVTTGSASHTTPAWSHDGRWIYFVSATQIFRIPSSGGDPVQVTRNGGGEMEEFADGKTLYYSRSTGGIWTIPVNGGPERLVPELADLRTGRSWGLASQGIYFMDSRTKPQSARFFNFRTRRLTTMLVPSEEMPGGTPSLALSPDGRYLLVTRVEHRVNDLMMIENFQ